MPICWLVAFFCCMITPLPRLRPQRRASPRAGCGGTCRRRTGSWSPSGPRRCSRRRPEGAADLGAAGQNTLPARLPCAGPLPSSLLGSLLQRRVVFQLNQRSEPPSVFYAFICFCVCMYLVARLFCTCCAALLRQ